MTDRSGIAEREYWRSLEELDGFVGRDEGGVSRRDFLKVIGAGLALAGLGACVEAPRERILPYTVRPPEVTPGVPRYYATTMTLVGYGTGLLVESREGRPTKVEGNPDHPASLGAANVFHQASVLQLYDPDRARGLRHRGAPSTWVSFNRAFAPDPTGAPAGSAGRGAGLRFLLEPTASPLTTELIARVQDAYPAARFHLHSPVPGRSAHRGAILAFGRPLQPVYDFAAADVIISLDADVLGSGPFLLRYARHFADRRRDPLAGMNRLYVAEGAPSETGGVADHRLRVRTGEIRALLEAVAAEIARGAGDVPGRFPDAMRAVLSHAEANGERGDWVRAAAHDLRVHAGAGIIVAGEGQPAEVHALAHVLNEVLGNTGRTVRYVESPLAVTGAEDTLADLAEEIRAGAVETLVILGGNPVYTAPADLEFGRLLESVKESVYLGLYENETAWRCTWLVPELHYLEAWGDARTVDGTASLVQPLIAPLYDGRTADEVLAVFLGVAHESAYERLRASWRRRVGEVEFEAFWEDALRRGVIPGSTAAPVAAVPDWGALASRLSSSTAPPDGQGIELTFRADACVLDGRFANNPWLQELPDPVTKLTWDNATWLSPRTAEALGVRSEDVIEIRYRGRTLRVPALVVPGHAERALTLPLGYGRDGAERVARGVGANAFAIRTADAPYFAAGAEVRRATRNGRPLTHRLARTQEHHAMNGRPIVLEATLAEYRANPDFTRSLRGRTLSLYRQPGAEGEQWAMTIDLGVCTGCSACVVACQAENNTPVVGKEGVLHGREMHWLCIDRYYTGEASDPGMLNQPMLCQHCEKAP